MAAMAPDYPASYIAYLIEFHATRDYFECHELLEEYWKEHPDDGYGRLWVGLIQIAVGSYHERRGNGSGARKMYRYAIGRLTGELLTEAGLDGDAVLSELRSRMERISEYEGAASAYADMNLPIADGELKRRCIALCEKRGLAWGKPSDLSDEMLVHRHKLRDRSDVIAARAEAASKKERDRT